MAGTAINFENSSECFKIKLNEKEASYLFDFLCKFETRVDKKKTKLAFDYNNHDIDFLFDLLKDVRRQIHIQADKAMTEEGLDLLKSDEAKQALKKAIEDFIDNLKDL